MDLNPVDWVLSHLAGNAIDSLIGRDKSAALQRRLETTLEKWGRSLKTRYPDFSVTTFETIFFSNRMQSIDPKDAIYRRHVADRISCLHFIDAELLFWAFLERWSEINNQHDKSALQTFF